MAERPTTVPVEASVATLRKMLPGVELALDTIAAAALGSEVLAKDPEFDAEGFDAEVGEIGDRPDSSLETYEQAGEGRGKNTAAPDLLAVVLKKRR